MAFTAHFIDSGSNPATILLDLAYFPHPHNGNDICELIKQVNYFKIIVKI